MDKLQLSDDGKAFMAEFLDENEYITAHTSGSTGTPKEIRLLKEDMRRSARATNEFFSIDENSLLVSPLSPAYIAGKMMIVRALEAGCRLIMEAPSNRPLREAYGPAELLPIVPSQIDGLLESPYLADIRNVIVGGAPMSAQQEKRLIDAGVNAYATYGMTETCSHIALRQVGKDYYEALPGVTFSTSDDSRLIISCERLSAGIIYTNDIVELADARHFRWLGRADNVVISGGVKLFPEEIERKIADLMPVPFYIAGEPDEKWGQRLALVAERPKTGGMPGAEGFDAMIAQVIGKIVSTHLAKYEIPKRLYFTASLPRTPNGKLRRVTPLTDK